MARLVERIFSAAQPVIARRAFRINGRDYAPGDAFPWKRLAVDQRRVKQMFDSGMLLHPEEVRSHGTDEMRRNLRGQDLQTLVAQAQAEASQDTATADAPATPISADAPATPISADEPADDLSDLNMKDLRRIAEEIDAPTRLSRADQRAAIRERRAEIASQE